MRIEWLGHASFRISSKEAVLYLDPYAGDYRHAPKADIILITHSHQDHFSQEAVKHLRLDHTSIFSPAEVSANIGGITIRQGDEHEVGSIKIKAVAAYNVQKSFHEKGKGVGFIVEIEGKKVYHSGDTDLIPEMNAYECDVALLPVGGTYTMDANEASSAAMILMPKLAVPMHWGTVVGHKEDALHFKEEVEKQSETKVVVLEPGHYVDF